MRNPLLTISNRGADGAFELPQDNWYHIIPKGEAPHQPSETMQILDDSALDAIINRFKQDSKQPNFALRVDYDHFSYDNAQSSEAAGWIENLQKRESGLWANIRWTRSGREKVTGGEFRFVSPVWLAADVENISSNRVRPTRLDSVALTNNPNLTGLVPLSNRDDTKQKNEPKKQKMNTLTSLLGLSPDASEASQVEALQAIKNRADEFESKNTALQTQLDALKSTTDQLKTDQVEADLEKYANRFSSDEDREKWRKALLADRSTAIGLIETISEKKDEPKNQKRLNRIDAKEPDDTPKNKEAQIKIKVGEFMNAAKGNYELAFNMAAEANPELFKFRRPTEAAA